MKIGQNESRVGKKLNTARHNKRIVEQDKNGNGKRQNKTLNQTKAKEQNKNRVENRVENKS